MKLREGIVAGTTAGPALGAAVGFLDCLRAAAEGGTVLTPPYWLAAVAIYAVAFLPLGLLAGLAGGLLFPRPRRAATLLAVLGSAAFAWTAYENIVNLPAFTAPESLRFDALVAGGTAVLFVALYLLPVPVPEPRLRTFSVLLAVPLLLAAAAPLLAPEKGDDRVEVELAPGRRPNVLFVLVDTLRADHLGLYGYGRDTSPRLERFAAREDAVVFTACRAASTWTKPSTSSILTGLLPTSHGAVEHREVLPEEAVTLAEILRSAGYRTAAFSDNPFVTPEFGFGQGFQEFSYQAPSVFVNGTLLGKALWTLRVVSLGGRMVGDRLAEKRGAEKIRGEVLDWIDGLPAGEPWFAYLHLMEPHLPYDPPAPFRGAFADPAYPGPDLDRPPRYLGFLPFERGRSLPEPQRRHLVARYDEEILAFDAAFGALVEALETRGALRDTVVVVTSDHGEEFHEHGGWTHGHSLYEELLRVPLVIRAPGLARAQVDWEVRATDLLPTVLSLAGIGAPTPGFGIDLAAALRAGEAPEMPVVSEVRIGGVGASSIVMGRRKLILAWHGDRRRTMAFDLEADPGETRPADEAPGRLRGVLRDVLRAAAAIALESRERALTAEEAGKLPAFGYYK